MNGGSGYFNGYGSTGSGQYVPGDGEYGSSSGLSINGQSGSGGRERRVGGYAGLSLEDSELPVRDGGTYQRSTSRLQTEDVDAEQRGQSSQDGQLPQGAGDSAARSQDNGQPVKDAGKDSRAIEDVLQSIQCNWDFMTSADCVPVQVALQLMDMSTLGKGERVPEFLSARNQVQEALKSVVNEHHQGFNSSIGTYHKIQSSIQISQGRIRDLRNILEVSKSGLLSTKPELKGLATSSQRYDDIIQLLTQIEEIQSLPERLESRLSDKRFLSAIEILQDAFRLLRRSELEHIGGLADIRVYFSNQESSLTDILIEELHDHLYLKSPYCSDRWRPVVTDGESKGSASTASWTGSNSWDRPVYSYLTKMDVSVPMVEDASHNPEADTFNYIRLLVEALNKIGHLDTAVDRIEQRLPVELFSVVDKTNAETDARYPNSGRGFAFKDAKAGLPTESIEKRGHVLSEFLWTLYAKFETIAEGHRVVHEVIAGITEREGTPKSSLLGGFKELWKLYQSEIRSLMHDYLSTDGESALGPMGENPDSKRQLYSGYRDKNRRIFKLSEVRQDSGIQAEQEELDEILRSSVPGLISKSSQKLSTSDISRSHNGGSGTGHKILIEPSVFNMGLLLPPSLSFIQRLKDIVPIDSGIAMESLTSFLDDFMVNVFLPQLDDTVTELCTLSFIAPDAFTHDPQWAKISPRPVFKGTVKFMSIIHEFSKMLSSIPHDQAFTRLLISQILNFYDKCCGWYRAIVTMVGHKRNGEAQLKAAAAYVGSDDVYDVVSDLWRRTGAQEQEEYIDREIELLLKRTHEVPLEIYDIISDSKTVAALSLLYNSMQWLAGHLAKLRQVTVPADTARDEDPKPEKRSRPRRWTLIGAMRAKYDNINAPAYLPLNLETASKFDSTLGSLRRLALNVLFTLHVDIRCNIIYMLTEAMRGSNHSATNKSEPTAPGTSISWWHILATQPTAASPAVLKLNNSLISFDTDMSRYLGPIERQFITTGLARFTDYAFVASTPHIGAMNEHGASRLQLDVLVLQQNLKNIMPAPPINEGGNINDSISSVDEEPVSLPRSAKFLDWFLEGAETAIDNAKEEKDDPGKAVATGNGEPFSYDEMRTLLDLCFSELLRGPRGSESREEFMAAKRAHADAMTRLDEVMLDAS